MMSKRQTVNLRYTTIRKFGDQDSEDRYLSKIEKAREAAVSEFTVAPGCSLPTAGTLLSGGAVVKVDDFHVDGSKAPARKILANHVKDGTVIRADAETVTRNTYSPNTKYVVGPGGGIVTRKGILASGAPIGIDDVGTGKALSVLVAAGHVVEPKKRKTRKARDA